MTTVQGGDDRFLDTTSAYLQKQESATVIMTMNVKIAGGKGTYGVRFAGGIMGREAPCHHYVGRTGEASGYRQCDIMGDLRPREEVGEIEPLSKIERTKEGYPLTWSASVGRNRGV